MKDKLLKIINHFGLDNQRKKLAEEQFELNEILQIATRQYNSKGYITDNIKKMVASEIADNVHLINQFLIKLEIPNYYVKEEYIYKVERTISKYDIEKEKKK